MELKIGHCFNCNARQQINVDNSILSSELDLDNYLKFKSVSVNVCEKCGYVSEDIFENKNINLSSIINSDEYKSILNYEYMGNFKELPDKEYLKLNINEFEAYLYVLEKTNSQNFLLKSLLLALISDLKTSLAYTYTETKYMKDDDDLNELYDELIDNLYTQAKQQNNQALKLLKGPVISNVYIKIFIAERLCYAEDYAQAKAIIEKVKNKHTLTQSLLVYIENFLTEVQ